MPRDFVISSLHSIEPHAVDDLPSLQVSSFDLGRVRALAEAQVAPSRIAAGVYDFEKAAQAVRQLAVDAERSPVERAMLVEHALTVLPKDACAHVALYVVGSLRAEQLAGVGRGGLLALRDAACLAEPECSRVALDQLDAELARRGDWSITRRQGSWLMEGFDARTLQFLDRLEPARAGALRVAVETAEARTDRGVLRAHLESCARRALAPTLRELLGEASAVEFLAVNRTLLQAQAQGSAWRALRRFAASLTWVGPSRVGVPQGL